MVENHKIVVIIPTYKDNDRLQICLSSLINQTLDKTRFEVIIANNDPSDSLDRVVLPDNARTITVEKPGSYAARNLAVSVTKEEFIAFIDSDCIPDAKWLESGCAALAASPGSRITGPIEIFREKGGSKTAFEYDFHTAFRIKEYVRDGRATTANLFVTRDVFERVGPFDENLLSGGDFEWNSRATRNGVPIVYDDEVSIKHPARRSVRDLLAKRKRVVRAESNFREYNTKARIKYLIRPPIGVIRYDRGGLTKTTKSRLFGVQYIMNIYSLGQWMLSKYGLVKQVRK